jgi:hypothetical protein
MQPNALDRIGRTARREAADWPEERHEQARKRQLIDTQEHDEETSHGKSLALAAATSRARWGPRRAERLGQGCLELALERRGGELGGPSPKDHDDIRAIGEGRTTAKPFAHESPSPVASDGVAHLARGDDAEPSWALARFAAHQHDEMATAAACPAALDTNEIGAPQKSASLAESLVDHVFVDHGPLVDRARLDDHALDMGSAPSPDAGALLLPDADGETLAAFAAAIVQDGAPTTRLHAGAEAVGAEAAQVVGLVGALHRKSSGSESAGTNHARGGSSRVLARAWGGCHLDPRPRELEARKVLDAGGQIGTLAPGMWLGLVLARTPVVLFARVPPLLLAVGVLVGSPACERRNEAKSLFSCQCEFLTDTDGISAQRVDVCAARHDAAVDAAAGCAQAAAPAPIQHCRCATARGACPPDDCFAHEHR